MGMFAAILNSYFKKKKHPTRQVSQNCKEETCCIVGFTHPLKGSIYIILVAYALIFTAESLQQLLVQVSFINELPSFVYLPHVQSFQQDCMHIDQKAVTYTTLRKKVWVHSPARCRERLNTEVKKLLGRV